jgi:hypothetical protein
MAHARQTGMLVMKPNKNELKPAIAAVAVTKDLCSSNRCQRDAYWCRRRPTLNTDCILCVGFAEGISPCRIVANTGAA